MEIIINTIKKNRFFQGAILIGGCAAAATAYILYSRKKQVTVEEHQDNLEVRIRKEIQHAKIVQYQQYKLYDLQTLINFTSLCAELAIPEFQEFAKNNRIERRKSLKNDQDKYYSLVVEFNNTLDKLIKYEGFDENCMKLSLGIFSREQAYMENLLYSIIQLKSSISSFQREITIQEAHSLLQYQINYLKSKPDNLISFLKFIGGKKVSRGSIVSSLKTIVFDSLFLEKGIEEEDFLIPTMQEEYSANPLSRRLIMEYSDAIMELIKQIQS